MKKEKWAAFDILKISMQSSKINSGLIALQQILDGLVPSLEVIAVGLFINTAMKILEGELDKVAIFLPIVMLTMLVSYRWMAAKVVVLAEAKLEFSFREKFRTKVIEKIAKLEYKYIENQETWDIITRIVKDMEMKLTYAYKGFLELGRLIIMVVGMIFIITTQIWWAGIVIVVMSIPLAIIALKSGKANYDAQKESSKYVRKYEYFTEVLNGREAAAERTLFGFSKKMSKRWYNEYETARKIRMKVMIKMYMRMKGSSIVTSIISLSMIMVLIPSVISGKLSVGMFIGITNGLFVLVSSMSWQLTTYLQEIAQTKELMLDIRKLMRDRKSVV